MKDPRKFWLALLLVVFGGAVAVGWSIFLISCPHQGPSVEVAGRTLTKALSLSSSKDNCLHKPPLKFRLL
jgi:hypothetical protein